MAPDAHVGFHAAYSTSSDSPEEKGAPNAVVGAYLGTLGLPQATIYYLTSAPPDGMQWLSLSDAASHGIEVRSFNLPEKASSPPPAGLSNPEPARVRVPKFRDYAAGRAPVTRRAPLDLRSKDAYAFRTRLRRAAQDTPNFAGHFVLATWGCGAECVTGAAVDLLTGKVSFLPANACCWGEVDSAFKPVEFRADSRLVVLSGMLNEEGANATHFFEFNGTSFREIATIDRPKTGLSSGSAQAVE